MIQHNVGDPVYYLPEGNFGFISQKHYDKKLQKNVYVITWFIDNHEIDSAWLDEPIIAQLKRDLQIYLGEIPPTQVR